MRSYLIILSFCAILLFGCSENKKDAGKYLKVEYPASAVSGELQVAVTYTIWIPEGVKTIRGVIVHQHGAGIPASKSGATAAYDLHWQALAKKWDCALLGPSYHVLNNATDASPGGSELWFDPRRGSEKTFLKALDDFAVISGHAELKSVPWCLWGHSGGGIWSDIMTTLYPERVAAVWLRSGSAAMFRSRSEFPQPQITEAVYKIPIMCNPGIQEKDKGPWTGTLATFREYRSKGAPIGFAPDPLTGHWVGDSRYLAIPFLDACLAMRLPDRNSKDQTLKPIDWNISWLAPEFGDTVMTASSFKGNLGESVWLPNETVAKIWLEYVRTGEVSDITPPPAPFNVRVTDKGNKVREIRWNAEADFESGIGCFVILRDGKQLARVPDKPLKRFKVRPLFQSGWINSYNDSPVDPVPEMTYRDSLVGSGEKHKYTIIAVNSVGLASKISDGSQPLPWQTEMPLSEAAESAVIENTLSAMDPNKGAMGINNLKMRTTLWGTPDRITISLTKNNVWDRRVHWYDAPTLKEITEGAFSPANKDYVGTMPTTLRPKNLGWLVKEGGAIDPYRQPIRYSFPCLKPVGQIILGIDALKGAVTPKVVQSCANGVTTLEVVKDTLKANVEYVLGMTSNIYAFRGNMHGIRSPFWLRLYRHKDTSHQMYMTADGKSYLNPAAEAEKSFNGPIDPPTSGNDGQFFWISQKMPAEKTFPQGFEYILMGVVKSQGVMKLESVEGKKGLGTPPPDLPMPESAWHLAQVGGVATRPSIAEAPGAAATATLLPGKDGKLEAFVTIVTTMDGTDLLTLAKTRLKDALARGFDGVVSENTKWWTDFYNKRENGRIFTGNSSHNASDNIPGIYQSWTDSHGGNTQTDMRELECSASYVLPEMDTQQWNSAPCYNEIFTTNRFVRNWGDSEEMWRQIVNHWMSAAKQNAHDMFNMPGMYIAHGYMPPIKPDRYFHITITLELCMGTMAQLIKPSWDKWDYEGDTSFLRKECYPLMKEMALFYAAYAQKGTDGYYHVIPSMQEESWGIYPKFSRNKDVISSLCMFRWALTKAAEAAEFLGVDTELSKEWRKVADQIVPYPTWKKPEGDVYAQMADLKPIRLPEDHGADAAAYPTILADEINLDSPKELIDKMILTVSSMPSGSTNKTLTLLGMKPDQKFNRRGGSNRDAGIEPETLLNSRSGRIHLFPLVNSPDALAFHNFLARGGFMVSSCRNSKGVYYIEIQPKRDNQCRLMNPWPGKQVIVHEEGTRKSLPVKIDKSNGECIIFEAIANHKYIIETKL
jgi:hypothetical protein